MTDFLQSKPGLLGSGFRVGFRVFGLRFSLGFREILKSKRRCARRRNKGYLAAPSKLDRKLLAPQPPPKILNPKGQKAAELTCQSGRNPEH